MVLHDRHVDPAETVNRAHDPEYRTVVADCLAKLEALIDAEIGADDDTWVANSPGLAGPR